MSLVMLYGIMLYGIIAVQRRSRQQVDKNASELRRVIIYCTIPKSALHYLRGGVGVTRYVTVMSLVMSLLCHSLCYMGSCYYKGNWQHLPVDGALSLKENCA